MAVAIAPRANDTDAQPVPPQIQNLLVVQRAGSLFVDITYDLIDPDSQTVKIHFECSSNGGTSYSVPVSALSGDVRHKQRFIALDRSVCKTMA